MDGDLEKRIQYSASNHTRPTLCTDKSKKPFEYRSVLQSDRTREYQIISSYCRSDAKLVDAHLRCNFYSSKIDKTAWYGREHRHGIGFGLLLEYYINTQYTNNSESETTIKNYNRKKSRLGTTSSSMHMIRVHTTI